MSDDLLDDCYGEIIERIKKLLSKRGEYLDYPTARNRYGFGNFTLGKHMMLGDVAIAAIDGYFVAQLRVGRHWRSVLDTFDSAYGPGQAIVLAALRRAMVLDDIADA
ncbi:MAG: hypothetical protein AB7L09_01610 [Nitrospira sp.]